MSRIIENYLFIDRNEIPILTGKNFILDENKELQEIGKSSKGITGSFKETNTPSAILFFYQKTDTSVLTEWREAKEKESSSPFVTQNFGFLTNQVTYYQVNLDFSKDILEMFQKMEDFNPFFWTKVDPINSKNPFAYFYLNGYPQFSYEGAVNGALIFDFFHSWYNRIDNKDVFRLKFGETSLIENKIFEGYYSVTDNVEYETGPPPKKVEVMVRNEIGSQKNKIKFFKDEVFNYTKETQTNGNITVVLTPLYKKTVDISNTLKIVESIKLIDFSEKDIIPYFKKIEKTEPSKNLILEKGVLRDNFWL